MKILGFLLFFFVLIFVASPVSAQDACAGVDRTLSPQTKALGPVIVKQVRQKIGPQAGAEILYSFRFQNWRILYVVTGVSDDVYLFYPGDPAQKPFVTTWGGAATVDEEQGIRRWTLKNAPGIPPRLASCFAWHVTKER